jgi:hypothetical protein
VWKPLLSVVWYLRVIAISFSVTVKIENFTSDDLEVLAQMKYLIEKNRDGQRTGTAKIIVAKIKSNENDTENSLPSTSVTVEKPSNINVLDIIERYEEQQNDMHRNVLQLTEMMKAFQEQSAAQEKRGL